MSAVYRILLVLANLTALLSAETAATPPARLAHVWDGDVIVVGGDVPACAAALAARKQGVRVFLLARRPHLGQDVSRRAILLPARPAEADEPPLVRALLDRKAAIQTTDDGRAWLPPGHVKSTLDAQLLAAGVEFLFGCYPVDVVNDAQGRPAGVVIANRSGRQVLTAKVLIDATATGTVARLAGAPLTVRPAGRGRPHAWTVGPRPPARAQPAETAARIEINGRARTLWRVEIDRPGQVDFVHRIEHWQKQLARICSPGTFLQSGPPAWSLQVRLGDKALADGPVPGHPRIWLLGSDAARTLEAPRQAIRRGGTIGQAAAVQARKLESPAFDEPADGSSQPGAETLGEFHRWVDRSGKQRKLRVDGWELPVLAEVDVVVVGGGTSGAPAGIAAARAGASTLVLEYQDELGGVSTLGRIGRYWHGYRGGFTAEIDAGIRQLNPAVKVRGKMLWYRRELLAAGGRLWTDVLAWGAWVRPAAGSDGLDEVTGVVVATPDGPGLVRAKVVIDATGAAVIAAAAGAEIQRRKARHLAVQGTGLPPILPGRSYTNTDYAFAAADDAVDAWRLLVQARQRFTEAFDVAGLLDTRERPRIVGDLLIRPEDIYLGRRYRDAVNLAKSNFDSHGYTVDDLLLLAPPDRSVKTFQVPLRALLPGRLERILVIGLGISADRDAIPVLRMQPDLQNQGYAAGRAAAMAAATTEGHLRRIDVRALQRHLVDKRILPESVLSQNDSGPVDPQRVARVVAAGPSRPEQMAVLLADRRRSIDLLTDAWTRAEGPDKLRYARILGILGDPTGYETLARAVRSGRFGKGWRFRGMGQFGPSRGEMDVLVIALGRCGRREAVEILIEKIEQLGDDPAFSHCRALAVALETLGDPRAAGPLAELLAKPGLSGHWIDSLHPGRQLTGRDDRRRSRELRELVLARALWRCGDHQGRARRILTAYARDLRGLYARHARAILAETRD